MGVLSSPKSENLAVANAPPHAGWLLPSRSGPEEDHDEPGQRSRRAAEAPYGFTYGFRRITLGLLEADHLAEGFDGMPDGVTCPTQLLAALKAAAPRLGLSPRLVHKLDWLFQFTAPQDWGREARPIVWPSASLQREALGLWESRVKTINRALIDAGLITMKDSTNGKRYGRRDPSGNIVEAYGFDLSPLATRHCEFLRLGAGQGRTEGDGPVAPAGDDRPERHHPKFSRPLVSTASPTRNGSPFDAKAAISASRSARWSGPMRWGLASRAWSDVSAPRVNA